MFASIRIFKSMKFFQGIYTSRHHPACSPPSPLPPVSAAHAHHAGPHPASAPTFITGTLGSWVRLSTPGQIQVGSLASRISNSIAQQGTQADPLSHRSVPVIYKA